jgi:hypothetical protein
LAKDVEGGVVESLAEKPDVDCIQLKNPDKTSRIIKAIIDCLGVRDPQRKVFGESHGFVSVTTTGDVDGATAW